VHECRLQPDVVIPAFDSSQIAGRASLFACCTGFSNEK
jgi:hypothetical protein